MLYAKKDEYNFYAVEDKEVDRESNKGVSLIVRFEKTIRDTINIEIITTVETSSLKETIETSYGELTFEPMQKETVYSMLSIIKKHICSPRCYGIRALYRCDLCGKKPIRVNDPWVLPSI